MKYEVSSEIKALVIERLTGAAPGQVFLIPDRIEDGKAIYRDAHVTTAKDLRARGVQTSYLVEPEDRRFLSEFSHDIVYQVIFGVAGNLTWDVAKTIWSYIWAQCQGLIAKEQIAQTRVHIVRLRKDDLEIEGLTIEAPASADLPEVFLRALVEPNERGD